jgi:hypothetical protein
LTGSGDKLKHAIHEIVDRSLCDIDDSIFKRTASQSLAHAALQAPPETTTTSVYPNGNHQGHYTGTASAAANTGLTAPTQAYAGVPIGTAYAYGNGTSSSLPQQTTGSFEQPYGTGLDGTLASSHATALQAASATTATQRPEDAFAYSNAQATTNGHQPHYAGNTVTPHEWHQFARTYMQQGAPQGDYLNTATTLMALGGREGGPSQSVDVETTGAINNAAMQGSAPVQLQWPRAMYSNGQMGQ